jgi:hypothetical protein
VLLENHVIRHMGDIEVIHTYEGTETMKTLIVGRDITGFGAFTREAASCHLRRARRRRRRSGAFADPTFPPPMISASRPTGIRGR